MKTETLSSVTDIGEWSDRLNDEHEQIGKQQATLLNTYLCTLQDTLTGEIFRDTAIGHGVIVRIINRLFPSIVISKKLAPAAYQEGKHWPTHALTMVGKARLNNIWNCLDDCDKHNIEGDFVECGAWRGGASIFAAAIIQSCGSNRQVICYDSFAGLPPAETVEDAEDPLAASFSESHLAVSLAEVQSNFSRFYIHRYTYCLKEGLFKNTLPHHRTPIAVLRADGDWHSSTLDILHNLYEYVRPGGYVIIDDYGMVRGCKIAVETFREQNGIASTLIDIDGSGVYWKKE